ncbi:solute carrier family 22 member 1-like [Periplaneta americana]|uniref:solute carrier family 22 member 1-like n=1 Tax=Periplaneta americana TaxID=6978 RepID=UPI0037E93C54
MAPTVRDVGGILQDVGGFGTYQKYLCFAVVGVISGLCSLTFATQLFSLVTPDHWCWNPELAALARQLPLPQEDTKKFSIPLVKERPLPWGEVESASYSQCQRFGGDLVGAYIGWVAAKRPHSHTPVTPGSGRPYPVRGCDQGWAYNHTFHTLTTENNWVCDSKWKPYAVHTAFWLGASLGAYVCGYMAKRFGRRLTLLLGMLINVIGGVATLVSSGFILLMLSRFVAGLGHLTVNYLALFLVLELCDEEHRVIPLLVMIAAYTTGSLTAPWVARAVVSWWWLTLIITLLSGIVCFTLSWIIPESPWWMLTKGHHKDAVQLLQRIAKVNGKAPWKINQKLLEESCDFWTVNCGRQQICCLRSNSDSKNDLFDLKKIRCNSCRKQFIILNAIWILCSSCYFGKHYISLNLLATAFNTRSDPSSDFTSYWYSALIEIPIWILPFILQGSPKMSQAALILSLTSAASLGIAHALLPTGNIVTSVTTGLIDRLVVTVAYYTMLQRRWDVSIADRITSVTMEISTGLAVSTVPAVIFVGEYYHQMPSLWFGTVASVAAVLSFFLPVSIESAGDQLTRQKDSVQWLRQCLQSTQLRRISLLSRDSQNEDESQVVSALPYNLLEST